MMFACIYNLDAGDCSRALQDCAAAFAPEAELTAPATIVFEAGRLERLYGPPEALVQAILQHARSLGLHVNVALAPNAEAAILAARNFPGATTIPARAAAALGELNVAQLPLTAEMAETFESWGVRKFEDLARLPATGIAERFGPAGVRLRDVARGAADRPLRIRSPETVYRERVELEYPLVLLEPLLFVLSRILNDQCARLTAHGMAAGRLRLTLELEDKSEHVRELSLPLAMRESKALLKLLHLDLEAHPPPAPTLAVGLELTPVQPRRVQNGLFLPATPAPDKLEITLARIRGLVGEENVGVAELLDTHRPEPFRLVKQLPAVTSSAATAPAALQLGFRYFRPPLAAVVQLDRERPLHVSAQGIRGQVVTSAGPWRSSGDWWTDNPWNRDEWDVSLSNGAIYRIWRENSAWFIEGAYD
jgi:protein ImuB